MKLPWVIQAKESESPHYREKHEENDEKHERRANVLDKLLRREAVLIESRVQKFVDFILFEE